MKNQANFITAALAALVLAAAPAFAQSSGMMHGNMPQGKMGKGGMMGHGMMMQTTASKKAQAQVNGIKSGKNYNCCIRPKCDWCAVHMGACPCGMSAASGKPVCVNCKGGWDAGQGVIPGKTAADIKVMTMSDMKGMTGGMGAMHGKMGHGKM